MNYDWLNTLFIDDDIFPVTPWDHQRRAIPEIIKRLRTNSAITVCMPTGAGKSNVSTALINLVGKHKGTASLFTNRKMLTKQTAEGLTRSGISYGVRAASMGHLMNLSQPIQISSMQTEISRCLSGGQPLHDAELAVVDEAHLMASGGSLKIIQRMIANGTKVVLVTATPVGLSHIAKELYVGATKQELFDCGAHVKAIIKSVAEMDLSRVRRVKEEDEYGNQQERFSVQDIRETAWNQAIVANVLEEYNRFNPDRRMAMGVAPGVPESRAMAEHFRRQGVRAAHIDAKEVFVDGEYKTDNQRGDLRSEVIERWKAGDIQAVWTCQVLREGIDLPGLFHLMLATPMLQLKDLAQTCGRVIRKSKETPDYVLIQDHGANFHRHDPYGSPNVDIPWHELYGMDDLEISQHIAKKKKDDPDSAPAPCPKCGTLVRGGRRCPPAPIGCGEPIDQNNPRKLRFVVQESGKLVEWEGDGKTSAPRKVSTDSKEQKQWDRLFWAATNSKSPRGQNFNQLRASYLRAHGEYPPDNLNNMPKDPADFGRKVKELPRFALRTKYNTPVDSGEGSV